MTLIVEIRKLVFDHLPQQQKAKVLTSQQAVSHGGT